MGRIPSPRKLGVMGKNWYNFLDFEFSEIQKTAVTFFAKRGSEENTIINKFLMTEDKLIVGIHLVQLLFTYSVCKPNEQRKETMPTLK